MATCGSDWTAELERWLEPFLDRLGHVKRRRMCPLYVAGLEQYPTGWYHPIGRLALET